MSSVTELVAAGEKMGLKAEGLQAFVTEQQAIEREERAKERDRTKERQLSTRLNWKRRKCESISS
jgi:hypothetical protein